MRLALSRLTAVIVIGVAIAAVPGVAVTRVSGREGVARMATRGGLHRLSTSEAVVLGYDDSAPDVAPAGDLVSIVSALSDGAGSPPALPAAATAALPPSAGSLLLAVPPPPTFHQADSFLRPLGRAPPSR
jgi:hypothetical protein